MTPRFAIRAGPFSFERPGSYHGLYGERKKSFRSDGWCIERIGEATRIYGLKMEQEAETPGESERSPAVTAKFLNAAEKRQKRTEWEEGSGKKFAENIWFVPHNFDTLLLDFHFHMPIIKSRKSE